MDQYKNFSHDVKEKAEHLSDHIHDKAHETYEQGKAHVHQAHKFLHDNAEDFAGVIKEKPIKSVLIAAGIGYLLSKIVH